jgi:hypothetical protein
MNNVMEFSYVYILKWVGVNHLETIFERQNRSCVSKTLRPGTSTRRSCHLEDVRDSFV